MDNSIQKASPESQGVSSAAILNFIDTCEKRQLELNSLMILRHGVDIAEGWYKPYGPDILHAMHSFTKSISAMAIGIAADEGYLSLDDKVISFFPDKLPPQLSENLKKMTVRHLLSMTCGHESETQSFMGISGVDYAKCFLSQEVKYKPGTHFAYNTLGSDMLGIILFRQTGLQMTEFLKPRIFNPLDITDYCCTRTHEGFEHTGGGLFLRTADMAKLGQLYLNKGIWNGTQLVPESFVNEATSIQIMQERNTKNQGNELFSGYGYQIWMNTVPNSYRFDGFYGQLSLVLPEQDMVITMTSSTMRVNTLLTTVWETILPGVSENAIEENETSYQTLLNKLINLRINWPEPQKRSEMESELHAKTFYFPNNNYSMIPEHRFWLLEREGTPSRGIQDCSFSFCQSSVVMKYHEDGIETEIEIGLNGEAIKGRLNTPGLEANILAMGTWLSKDIFRVDWRHYMTANHRVILFAFNNELVSVTFSETPNDIDNCTDFLYLSHKTFECTFC